MTRGSCLLLAIAAACSAPPRERHVEPQAKPVAQAPAPRDAASADVAVEPVAETCAGESCGPPAYRYLDGLAQVQLARIIKEASASDGSTEVTIALGADRGVVSDSRATVLDGNKDLPLSGGDISITRVERRVTVGVVQLSAKQLHGNTRVRVLPPKLPVPAPSHAPSNAPHGIARIEIQYSFAALHCANAHRYAIDWTPNGYRSDAAKIDTALIDALHSSLTDLTSSDREQTCADHTDDYPSFEVAFGDDPTTPAVVLTSESNCRASNAPWNVLRGGQRFAQDSGAIGNAVHALLEAIDPVRWQPGGDPRFNWYRRCEPSHR